MSAWLEARGLCVDYRKVRALKDVGFEISRGEFAVLIGPNGSGKTTLLRALVGATVLSKGGVCIGGHDLAAAPRDAKMGVGFCIAPGDLPKLLTGRECLALFAGARGLPEIPPPTLSLAKELDLLSVLDWRVEEYSLGMRQKIGILLGLIGEPPLLFLDEPFNGLDPYSSLIVKRYLADAVAKRQVCILLATHDLGVAEHYATRVLLLVDGQLRKNWTGCELAGLRKQSGQSLEQVLAKAGRPPAR